MASDPLGCHSLIASQSEKQEVMTMECKNCPYYFKGEDDDRPRCQFVDLRGEPTWLDVPPCEED